MRIVCAGEAMIELAPMAAGGAYKRSFAGDTFNTAWYLAQARPDWTVDYVTCVGRDSLSDDFCRFAGQAGIGTGYIARHDTRTLGLYLIELQGAERSFQYWRDGSAARTLADDPAVLDIALRGADLIYFSGITLAILEPGLRARFLGAVGEAKALGAAVAFDPNLRLRLWADADSMRQGIMDGAEVADLVLPSYDEEAQFFGDADPAATIARYRSAGASCVVVKNGEGQVHFGYGEDAGWVLPKPAKAVVDTTAAGDSFNAGFIAHYLEGAALAPAIEAACAVSGQVIGQRGALVDLQKAAVI